MDVHRSGFAKQRKLLEQAENILNGKRDERVLVKLVTLSFSYLASHVHRLPACLTLIMRLTARCSVRMKHSISSKWTTGCLQIEYTLFLRGRAKSAKEMKDDHVYFHFIILTVLNHNAFILTQLSKESNG